MPVQVDPKVMKMRVKASIHLVSQRTGAWKIAAIFITIHRRSTVMMVYLFVQ